MAHFHSKHPTKLPLEVVQAVGETLLAMKYVSRFVVDEKRQLYELAWTDLGAEFADQFTYIYHEATNRMLGDERDSFVPAAISEILSGRDL